MLFFRSNKFQDCAEKLFRSKHSTSITTRVLFFTMGLIYTLLMAALGLTGITFNLRMLRSRFKDKTKYTFLQKCRTLAVCQCACQVIILLADAVESWKGLETEPRESCNVLRVLSSSMLFFQACNLMAILSFILTNPQRMEPRSCALNSRFQQRCFWDSLVPR